jgi:hypothetical protein
VVTKGGFDNRGVLSGLQGKGSFFDLG